MVKILSRNKIQKILALDKSISDYAVISFCDTDLQPVDYQDKTDRIFIIKLDDIGIEEFATDKSYQNFFIEANDLAKFIFDAKNDGYKFICQCEFGQSRSAACAAAILQHFDKSGIKVFASYKYYPNKPVYHKLSKALEEYGLVNNL